MRGRSLTRSIGGTVADPFYDAVPSLAMLKAFDAYCRAGGVRRAAIALGVDHAVVSRHIRALETHLATALLERGGTGGRLTSEGAEYHRRLSAALQDIAAASEALRRRDTQRLLVWCVPGFAYHWLARRLPEFHARHAAIDIEIRPSDTAPDFAVNEADADLRYVRGDAPMTDPLLRTTEIARPPILPVASPGFLAKHGAPAEVEELAAMRLLHEESDAEWRAWLEANGLKIDGALPGARLWQAHLAIDAARTGQGVALANCFLLGDGLADGSLVDLRTERMKAAPVILGGYRLSARRDRWSARALARFREWLLRTVDATGDQRR